MKDLGTCTKWTFLPADNVYTEGDYVCTWGEDAETSRDGAKREFARTGRPQALYKLTAVELYR